MSAKGRPLLLIVEDDALFARSVARVLKGYEVAMVSRVSDALAFIAERAPKVVLLDIMLRGENGLDLLEKLKDRIARPPVIALTAVDSLPTVVRAMSAGASNYLTKPVSFEELELAIEKAIETSALREEVQTRRDLELAANLERPFLGESPEIRKIRQAIATVAPTDSTVLITGESGTGKELVARSIHAASARARRPFVAVNCGAIPGDLFEAEFFGFRKGAFTGAQANSAGKFRLADGGTLLLDEIGDLPLDAQVKFLRALEEQEFYPVGSNELVRVDTRVLASSHRNLSSLVESGQFREDLFYRLNVFQIYIPPLRARPDDVMVLARAFLEHFEQKFRKGITGFSKAAEEVLKGHAWKGNGREVRNVMERLMLSSVGGTVEEKDVAGLLRPVGRATPSGAFELPADGLDLDQVERSLLEQALRRSGGNKSQAARLLGLTRATLSYRIDKFGLG